MKKILLLLSFFLTVQCIATAQKTTARDQAMQLFDAKLYHKTLPILLEYQKDKPKDIDIKYPIGVCLLQMGQAARGQQYLEAFLSNTKYKNDEALWYLARCFHHQAKYEEAVKYYKMYLGKVSDSDPKRASAKGDIQRCMRGLKMQYAEQRAYVDNLGEAVNTELDEYAPVVAQNGNDDVLFFSAQRPENLGGARAPDGKLDERLGTIKSDIFITQVQSGEWLAPERQPEGYNTAANDQILDLSPDGTFLYIAREEKNDPSNITYIPFIGNDSINTKLSATAVTMPEPINSSAWDGDSYFFRDSILLFSSNRAGGQGGNDLYISYRNRDGNWGKPLNLGGAINTPFDEVSPFLAKDGRTLYYSSNNLNSIGGFDVFKTVFVDTAKAWTVPENLGVPINSPADEQYLRVTNDGNRGYFASNRPGSRGARDLYVAYFKAPAKEQLKPCNPASFVEVLIPILRDGNYVNGVIKETPIELPVETNTMILSQYKIAPILYNETTMSLVPTTINTLNQLAAIATKFPKTKLEFTIHTDDEGSRNFSIYFSVKRLEELSAYLLQKNVTAERMILKSVGMSYPIAKNRNTDETPNEVGRSLNRRVDVRILNTDGLPIKIEYPRPEMSQELNEETFAKYEKAKQGLTFKVQVKATKQLFDDPVIANNGDAMIELNTGIGTFRYSIGLYKTFALADAKRAEVATQGFRDAFVVAYMDGIRIPKEQLPDLIAKFPDLKNMIKE